MIMSNNDSLVLCPSCYSDNIEQHGGKKDNPIKNYICCNCFFKFNNYDFILFNKVKYRILSLELNETSYESIIKNSIKNITFNGILDYMGLNEFSNIMKMNGTPKENIVILSKLETNLKHFNDIKAMKKK